MAVHSNSSYRLSVLVGSVFVSGAAQGMLLPLLSILLEDNGTPAALNGINASALYIGVLLASPFIEKPMRRFGYQPILTMGLIIVAVALALFPVMPAFWAWFALRLIVGVGDNMLHFSAQVWIMVTSPEEKKGRNIAIYGVSFGLGFAVGPLMARLLDISNYLPFFVAAGGCILLMFASLFLKNDYPDQLMEETGQRFSNLFRYKKVIRLSWAGLAATFAYGFLEASLNGNFPVFGLRSGLTIKEISILLPIFVVGSLITQIPMGILSDKIGRRRLILFVTFFGTLGFISAVFLSGSFFGLAAVFLFSGMFVGSLYSMGMTFISDLLPPSLLPVGNILAGVTFSFGSMLGPFIGGLLIRSSSGGDFFYGIAGALFLAFICSFWGKRSLVKSHKLDV